MICSSPLTAFYSVKDFERTGKKNLIFNSNPICLINSYDYEMIQVPCGHCIECRINKAKDWATRSVLESRYHSNNYFLTLTYDDDHEHIIKSVDRNSGFVTDVPDLVYRDIQLFLKRLRKKFHDELNFDGLRFLCSGEYGNLNGRAHFHLLLFDCPIPDLTVYKIQSGLRYFTSEFIGSCWHPEKSKISSGFHLLTELDYGTACYTAKYCIKKLYGKYERQYQELCRVNGVEPLKAEFLQVSRAGGIGIDFYRDSLSIEDLASAKSIQVNDGCRVQIPKFFKRVFREHPEDISDFEHWDFVSDLILENNYQIQKDRIDSAERSIKRNTSLDYYTYLKNRHDSLISELRNTQFAKKMFA